MTELRTARLILRPARPGDAPCYALGVSEFAVARWLTQLPWPYTLSMASDFLRHAPTRLAGQSLFIIEHPDKGLIGCIAIGAELGFWIARPHWRQGYGAEALTAVLDWHFAQTGFDHIQASSHVENRACQRLLSRLGFAEYGRRMCFSQALQHNVPHIVSRLRRADWLEREISQCA